jgi:hypothetical protein
MPVENVIFLVGLLFVPIGRLQRCLTGSSIVKLEIPMIGTTLTAVVASWGLTGAASPEEENRGCRACHTGIEDIRDPTSGMMQAIYRLGRVRGDSAGCVVCQGGDPAATEERS